MALPHASYGDARTSVFNNAGRDQVNVMFGQSLLHIKQGFCDESLYLDGRDILDKLEPVRMDPSSRTECLSTTRRAILKFIVDWTNDTTNEQKMLWIYGLAGSGKSTLSTTIASIFRDSGQLGAFLFFDHDVTERSDPTRVIKTLAHQLATFDPRIGAAVRAVVENSNMLMSPLPRQFQTLILEPLSKVERLAPAIIVIVLDSLDECGTKGEREALLEVLTKYSVELPVAIRIVVTSRAESDIYNAFQSRPHILAYELDVTSSMNSDDILSYFRHRMSLICTRNRHLLLGTEWPGEEALHELVQRACGLFVWASTASEFINGHSPRKRLDLILRGEKASSAETSLDALYKTALESAGHWDDEDFVKSFRDILGTILVARQPLSSAAIDSLLQSPEDMPSIHTISLLACLMQQSPTVRVLHPSFADFLQTKGRCGRDIWFFDGPTYHRRLAVQCLDRIDVFLKRNMCNMTLGVDLTTEYLPEAISYSCAFWIDHVSFITNDVTPIVDRLGIFLFRHLLHWFEATSILRRSREMISRLDQLLKWISVSYLSSVYVIHPCADF
jgi:energy-coupling factor transporter ATP-binding protein EcfA2